MRLTLRTLLAYLDDVLDPADKEELSQKIESSEFAEDLVHRTRDTMRRLRLSAPQVIGTGIALDPNTVSEYLDNVLPPEQVGDFERICLESDVHLAEAAACHHVLTMVLGEPADVDPRMRQRMYGVPAEARERKRVRIEAAHGAAASVGAMAPLGRVFDPEAQTRREFGAERQTATSGATAPVAHQPAAPIEVPEYLRAGNWWQSRAVLAGLAALLLVGITVYLASGLMGWFGGPNETAVVIVEGDDQPLVASGTADQSAAAESGGTTLAPPPQPLTPGNASPPAGTTATTNPYDIQAEATAEETPDRYQVPVEPAGPPAPEASPGTAATAEGEVDRYGLPVEQPTADIPGPMIEVPVPPSDPVAEIDDATDTPTDERVAIAGGPAVGALDELPEVDGSEEVPAGPRELGTYLGGQTVLLRYDEESGAWLRVAPRDAVAAGQRLVALPEFRPKVTLASNMHLDVSGGTQVILATADELEAPGLPEGSAEVPALEVVYGRIVLINTSMVENEVRLKLGPTIGNARLARSATLAVEVERQYLPGSDPRETPAPVIVRLYAPDGGVIWQDASGERTAADASRWTIEGGVTSELVADDAPPAWIDQEPGALSSEQRFGAPVVESELVSNRPVDTQLLEIFQGNSARREVKSLVTRSGIHVGLFEPFVDALRDSEQRANWDSHIKALCAAMALSSQSASRVWDALAAQRGERAAADLYEMLCGYSLDQIGRTPEQRKSGALARLIDWLEEDSLDYRVLAVHDLAEITGKRLMSNPAAGAAERSQNVRRWRSRLQSDELRPLEEQQ